MTDGVFCFVTQLGKSLVITIRLEDGVVAKAFVAALLLGNLTIATALEIVLLTIEIQRYHCSESRLTIGPSLHGRQHLIDIILIAAMLTSITCRIHPGSAT